MKNLNEISYKIIGCAYTVHSELGPGLMESVYEACLAWELQNQGIKVKVQKALPVVYKDIKLDVGFRIDLLIEDSVIIELKAVQEVAPLHEAQLLTYLKLANKKLGLLINFNVTDLKKGIMRRVM